MVNNRARLYNIAAAADDPLICMGDDSRLPAMPKCPSLLDFFQHRFDPIDHLLQSARLARLAGQDDRTVLACLLHDIAVFGFIRGDHGFWGQAMVAPYVDEEISWAIRMHQVLRFFPDESVGYSYPEVYKDYFGESYKPDEYILHEYSIARNHKWYGMARAITLYDLYSFNDSVKVPIAEFDEVLGRHFRQPTEGLGFDGSPCAHIWRTILRPNKFL
jgi:hypothetical protein